MKILIIGNCAHCFYSRRAISDEIKFDNGKKIPLILCTYTKRYIEAGDIIPEYCPLKKAPSEDDYERS